MKKFIEGVVFVGMFVVLGPMCLVGIAFVVKTVLSVAMPALGV